MREIEFRAKCKLLGKMMYGSLYIKKNGKVFINSTEVYEETVSQFTGLRDKNCLKIYEGDIIVNTKGESNYKLIVVYHRGAFRVKFFINKDEPYNSATYGKDYCQYLHESKYSSRFRQNPQHYEVVGNIYLKEKENVR